MGRLKKRRTCVKCGGLEHVNPRSNLCSRCADDRAVASIKQLMAHEGPIYDKWLANWRDGVRRKIGGVPKA
mgnify:CR=1 FL=1